jgi:tRNA-binding protein
VDFGAAGVRKSSAQITRLSERKERAGKQVIGVLNFPRNQIGRFFPELLITGFADETGSIVLAVPNGSRLA